MRRPFNYLGAIIGGVALMAPWVSPRLASGLVGDADGTFGNCGVATARVTGATNALRTVMVQPDGKIVAAGDGVVLRFTPGGALDSGFGTGGIANLGVQVVARGLARQSDGMIVVSGGNVLARLDAAGALDPSFGVNGIVLTQGASDGPVIVTPGGRVITTAGGVIAAFTSAGQVDTTFAVAGVQPVASLRPFASLRQENGRIVVAGAVGNDIAVVRLLADGSFDDSFDGDGIVIDNVGGPGEAHGVVQQTNGKLVTGGGVVTSGTRREVVLTRYDADGSRDTSFGIGGHAVHGFTGFDEIAGLALLPDGKLVAGGKAVFAGDADVFVTRFTDDGNVDASFGLGGATYLDYGAAVSAQGFTMQADGRPLVAGGFGVGSRSSMAVWRFQPDGSTAAYPGTGYVLDGYGGLHPFATGCAGTPPLPTGNPGWPGWDIARDVAAMPAGEGIVLDGYGGLHGFKTYDAGLPKPTTNSGPAWPGWDIARGVAVMPDGTGGYVVDGFGGLHRFGVRSHTKPAATRGGPKWPGWDIARDVALYPDGTGGYVLDGYGGLHPFAVGFNAFPPRATGGPSWVGIDIARSVVLLADGSGGYVLDGHGGLHPFGIDGQPPAAPATGGPTWVGWDIARGASILP